MLILHIGLPKTGTTLLQHRIFGRAPGVTFVHRARGGEAAAAAADFRLYARVDRLRAVLYRHRLRQRLNAFAARGRPVLLTEENISVSPARFWQDGGATPAGLALRLAALAGGLDPALQPLRLIVGIRRQDQWLASRYAESSRHFPGFGQADFDRRMAEIAAMPVLAGPLAWLDFRAMRDSLAAVLGRDNVHLVPLERLVSDPVATLGDLARFLGGLDLVAGSSASRVHAPRNRLSDGENRWRLRRDGSALALAPELATRLRTRFAASNRELALEMELGFEP